MLVRRSGVAVLCVAFLVGMLGTSLDHLHPSVEHRHGAQTQHRHESLLHAHVADSGDSDSDPHLDIGEHGHHNATVIDQPCYLVRARAMHAAPGMVASALQMTIDPAGWYILDRTPVSPTRDTQYLIGPGLRGPPA